MQLRIEAHDPQMGAPKTWKGRISVTKARGEASSVLRIVSIDLLGLGREEGPSELTKVRSSREPAARGAFVAGGVSLVEAAHDQRPRRPPPGHPEPLKRRRPTGPLA